MIDKTEIERLCEMLLSPSPAIRSEAQKKLLSMGEPAFIPLTEVFRFINEGNVRVIVSMLKQIDPVRALNFIIEAARDADYHIRLKALETASIFKPFPTEIRRIALKDPIVVIRKKALQRVLPGDDIVADLMVNDPDREIRRMALFKLAEAGDKRATEPIMAFYQSGEGMLRGDAVRWLGELQDVRSVPLLIEALGDESGEGYATGTWRWVTRHKSPGTIADEAYDALKRMGFAAQPMLKAALNHPNPRIRQQVRSLLG